MVLRGIGEIEEGREEHRKQFVEDDSGHDENDELLLVKNSPDSDEDHEMMGASDSDVAMYSSDDNGE